MVRATSSDFRKRHDEALAIFEKAIELDPEFASPWTGKGVALAQQKRYDEAQAAFEKAIELDPKLAYPWNGKGNTLAQQKRYDEALAAFEKAIELDPELAYPWNGKGNVLRDQKHYDEALAAYQKAIELDPEYAHPWTGKGNILSEQNNHDEAQVAFERAIELDPEDAYAWNGKGSVFRFQKHYGEALAAYEKAIELKPEYVGSTYNMGLLYWELKEPVKVIEAFRKAIELGLEAEWESIASSWIERAQQMIESQEAGETDEKRDEKDRSSDKALVTDLFEALKDELPSIRKKKIEFNEQIAKSVGKSRIAGTGGVEDALVVLRDWNSFSPVLRRDVRAQDGPGPNERLGGGYYIVWKGHGIVVDPGVDFVSQLYRKGLSVADIDTVIITHCHLAHTRDVESLVDLNYRYNQTLGYKPHPRNDQFRQLRVLLCDPAFIKYSDYLKNSGCCHHPKLLDREDGNRWISDLIHVQPIPVQHCDINGRDDEAIGLVFSLKDENGRVVRLGITSDSKWIESLPESFAGCDVLVAHLGTIEVGEGRGELSTETMTEGFLEVDLKNHLGAKGCFRLLQRVKPKIFIIGEFGEELVETRSKILRVFNQLKPSDTHIVLGGDSNLVIGLAKELSVCCSHHECKDSWTRIPLDQVRPALDEDFLFQYFCPHHGILE